MPILNRWNDLDSALALVDEFRKRMGLYYSDDAEGEDAWITPWSTPSLFGGASVWPRVNMIDTGGSLVLTAEVPGLTEKDIQVSINQDVVSLSGDRKLEVPAGYTAYRQERSSLKFARNFALPVKVDAEKCTATVQDGLLTVVLSKAPEATPRQIAIKAQ